MSSDFDGLSATERLALAEGDGDVQDALRELVYGGNQDDDSREDEGGIEAVAASSLRGQCRSMDEIEIEIDIARGNLERLEKDYEAGESDLTYDEYRQEIRQLNDRVQDLREERSGSKALLQIADAAEEKEWRRQIDLAKQRAMRQGIDLYDTELEEQWDRCVRYLGSQAENATKSGRWFLDQALAMVRVRLEDGGRNNRKSSRDLRKDHDRSFATPSGTEASGDHISRLKGLELEAALARMSPEQAEAWLTS